MLLSKRPKLVSYFRIALPISSWPLLSWPAWLVFAVHCVWFDGRARGDEAHLAELFGAPYREYAARVKRWLPGVY